MLPHASQMFPNFHLRQVHPCQCQTLLTGTKPVSTRQSLVTILINRQKTSILGTQTESPSQSPQLPQMHRTQNPRRQILSQPQRPQASLPGQHSRHQNPAPSAKAHRPQVLLVQWLPSNDSSWCNARHRSNILTLPFESCRCKVFSLCRSTRFFPPRRA